MRLLFIHPFLFRYVRGIERYTLSLSSALARRGVEVDLLTWRWPESRQVTDLDPRVRVWTIPTSRYYAPSFAIPFYTAHLLTHTYDYVWVNFAGYGEAEAITLASHTRPLTYGITFHYPYNQAPHRYHEFERYGFARGAQALVTVSSYVAGGVSRQFGRDPVVIRSAADTAHFMPNRVLREAHRAALDLDPDATVVLTAAALEERKGIQYLIRALPRVLATQPRLVYLVLGEGPYRPALEALSRDLGLEKVVQFRGTTTDMYPYYNAADLFALLSAGEGLPAAPLEAMAMGLPLLTSDYRPFDELIEPGYSVCVRPDDTAAVGDAVAELLADPERRRAMGQGARARAVADFTYDAVAARYIEVCSGQNPSAAGPAALRSANTSWSSPILEEATR